MKTECPKCKARNTLRLSSDIMCTGCNTVYHVETDRERDIRIEVERKVGDG